MAWFAGFISLALVIVSVLAVRKIRVQAHEIGELTHEKATQDRTIKRLTRAVELAREPAFDDYKRRNVFANGSADSASS